MSNVHAWLLCSCCLHATSNAAESRDEKCFVREWYNKAQHKHLFDGEYERQSKIVLMTKFEELLRDESDDISITLDCKVISGYYNDLKRWKMEEAKLTEQNTQTINHSQYKRRENNETPQLTANKEMKQKELNMNTQPQDITRQNVVQPNHGTAVNNVQVDKSTHQKTIVAAQKTNEKNNQQTQQGNKIDIPAETTHRVKSDEPQQLAKMQDKKITTILERNVVEKSMQHENYDMKETSILQNGNMAQEVQHESKVLPSTQKTMTTVAPQPTKDKQISQKQVAEQAVATQRVQAVFPVQPQKQDSIIPVTVVPQKVKDQLPTKSGNQITAQSAQRGQAMPLPVGIEPHKLTKSSTEITEAEKLNSTALEAPNSLVNKTLNVTAVTQEKRAMSLQVNVTESTKREDAAADILKHTQEQAQQRNTTNMKVRNSYLETGVHWCQPLSNESSVFCYYTAVCCRICLTNILDFPFDRLETDASQTSQSSNKTQFVGQSAVSTHADSYVGNATVDKAKPGEVPMALEELEDATDLTINGPQSSRTAQGDVSSDNTTTRHVVAENKLQAIEMQMLQLENQLLHASISRNDDDSTHARLQNDILKLENQLLRLNSTLHEMKSENEQLRQQLDSSSPTRPSSDVALVTAAARDSINEFAHNLTQEFVKLQEKYSRLERDNAGLVERLLHQSETMNTVLLKLETVGQQQRKQETEIDRMKRAAGVGGAVKYAGDGSSSSSTDDTSVGDQFNTTPIYKTTEAYDFATDCYDLHENGVRVNSAHVLRPAPAVNSEDVEAFCDMSTGGWTVIQRRLNGSTDFYRPWTDYKHGFGDRAGEHWLGNDVVHLLTNQDDYSLVVELTSWNDVTRRVQYESFRVGNESDGYRLSVAGFRDDTDQQIGDSLLKHNGCRFSTSDVDNDEVSGMQYGGHGSCARRFSGAWWYYACYMSNLNGKYYDRGLVADNKFDGVAWKSWTGSKYSLKAVEMKIRPRRADRGRQ